jgi:hypothetical protein
LICSYRAEHEQPKSLPRTSARSAAISVICPHRQRPEVKLNWKSSGFEKDARDTGYHLPSRSRSRKASFRHHLNLTTATLLHQSPDQPHHITPYHSTSLNPVQEIATTPIVFQHGHKTRPGPRRPLHPRPRNREPKHFHATHNHEAARLTAGARTFPQKYANLEQCTPADLFSALANAQSSSRSSSHPARSARSSAWETSHRPPSTPS